MAVKFLPGAQLNVYYEERRRDQRILRCINALVWIVVALAVLVTVLNP